jgi:hypothetical protein
MFKEMDKQENLLIDFKEEIKDYLKGIRIIKKILEKGKKNNESLATLLMESLKIFEEYMYICLASFTKNPLNPFLQKFQDKCLKLLKEYCYNCKYTDIYTKYIIIGEKNIEIQLLCFVFSINLKEEDWNKRIDWENSSLNFKQNSLDYTCFFSYIFNLINLIQTLHEPLISFSDFQKLVEQYLLNLEEQKKKR